MYHFPDAAKGLATLLDGLGTSFGTSLTTYLRLQADFTDHLPAVHVMRVGGQVGAGGILRQDRVNVVVYDRGSRAQDVAEEIRAAISDRDHDVVGVGLLDRVSVAEVPTDVPYPSDVVAQCAASYLVDTRPLPEPA